MKTVSAQTVTEFIHRSWIDTICTPAQQGAGELPLPKPFVVPTEYAMPPMLGWTAGTFLAATAWGRQKKVGERRNLICNS